MNESPAELEYDSNVLKYMLAKETLDQIRTAIVQRGFDLEPD